MAVALAFLLGLLVGVLLAGALWFWFTRRKIRTMFGGMFPGVDGPMSFMDPNPCAARCVLGEVAGLTDRWQEFMVVTKGARIALHTVDDDDHDVNIDLDVAVLPEAGDVRAAGDAMPGRVSGDRIVTVTTATGAVVELRLHSLTLGRMTAELDAALPADG